MGCEPPLGRSGSWHALKIGFGRRLPEARWHLVCSAAAHNRLHMLYLAAAAAPAPAESPDGAVVHIWPESSIAHPQCLRAMGAYRIAPVTCAHCTIAGPGCSTVAPRCI